MEEELQEPQELELANTETAIQPAQEVDIEIEDPRLQEGLTLPSYDDMDDKKVMKNVNDVYRGISLDNIESVSANIKTAEQLSHYVDATMSEIKESRHRVEAQAVLQSAADMARFWHLSKIIQTQLDTSALGVGTAAKIAAALRYSVPYIYSIRAVACVLTLSDCYLLGMRGCTSTMLRELAYGRNSKDPATVRGIVRAFIDSTTESMDKAKLAKARKALTMAVNMKASVNALEIGTSDPTAGGSPVLVSTAYQNVMTQMLAMKKMLKKLANPANIDKFCDACADFGMPSSIPDAETHLREVKDQADEIDAMLKTVASHLADIKRELDSVRYSEVVDSESTDGEAGN